MIIRDRIALVPSIVLVIVLCCPFCTNAGYSLAHGLQEQQEGNAAKPDQKDTSARPAVVFTDTEVDETAASELPWGVLDRAREFYLAGDTASAFQLLNELIEDTLILDQKFINARRELTAYALSAAGSHEQAFDTLQLYVADRVHALELEREAAITQLRSKIKALEHEQAEQQRKGDQRLEAQGAELRSYLYMAAGVVALLFLITLLLLLRKRRPRIVEVEIEREQPKATVSPAPGTAPAEAAEQPARLNQPVAIPGEPMDAAIMLDHASQVSNQLNKGATVEAAGHLGILIRFLRLVLEHSSNGQVPVQQALVLFRQYLKLEGVRTGSKVRYSVDAQRPVMEQDPSIPAMAILSLLSKVMQRTIPITALSVELVPSGVGKGVQCIIKIPVDPARSETLGIIDRDLQKGLRLQHQLVEQEEVLRVEWHVE